MLLSRNQRRWCSAAMIQAPTSGFISGTNDAFSGKKVEYAFPLSLLQQTYLLFLSV